MFLVWYDTRNTYTRPAHVSGLVHALLTRNTYTRPAHVSGLEHALLTRNTYTRPAHVSGLVHALLTRNTYTVLIYVLRWRPSWISNRHKKTENL